MSQKKTKQNYTVEELIKELSTLVENISNGEIHVGKKIVSINSPISIKVKQKIKDSVLTYELSFQAPLTDQKHKKTPSPKIQATKNTSTRLQNKARIATKRKPEKMIAKKPKKEAARLWKLVMQKIDSGSAISDTDADSLLNICTPSMYQDEKWYEEWISCCKKVKESIEATAKGDYNLAKELVAEIKKMTHTCHKKYK